MHTISISYAIKWRLDFANHYLFTTCGKCFNSKTGKQIKKVYNCRCIGYCINGKFQSLSQLRPHMEQIPTKQKLPF